MCPTETSFWNGDYFDRLIRDVLIHEMGHNFGFSDAGMALIKSGITLYAIGRG